MDKHAIALLAEAESWTWPATPRILETGKLKQGGNYMAIMLKLLSYLIMESQLLGGTVLNQFWKQLGECHPKVKENVDNLIRNAPSVPFDEVPATLFEGVDRNDVDFEPIFKMAAEYFTHLGIAFMKPEGPKSGGGTPHSVGDIVKMETNQLLSVAQEPGFGVRKQAALKRLSFKRDGYSCVMSGVKFDEVPDGDNYNPILTHIIPNSVHGKPETLKCIAMFAGNEARDLVIQHLNAIGNVVNLQQDAHSAFNNLQWGIEARNTDGKVRIMKLLDDYDPILTHIIPDLVHGKPDTLKCITMFAGNEARDLVVQHWNAIGNVMNLEINAHSAYDNLQWGIEARNADGKIEYVYRRVPLKLKTGPASITLRDGDLIKFGLGTEGLRHGGGPLPLLCNLQLAVARVLKMSGAAEVISQLMYDADDSDFPHNFLFSNDFCDILDAKLLLKGI